MTFGKAYDIITIARWIFLEAFEITFFYNKSNCDIQDMDIFIDYFRKYIKLDNDIQFDKFDDDKDYYEIRCCIFGLILEKNTFKDFAESVGRYAEYIFGKFRSVEIVTGIYEITYYYTEKLNSLSEFSPEFLKNFPLVFIRNQKYDYQNVFYRNDNIICLYNNDAQVLFSY